MYISVSQSISIDRCPFVCDVSILLLFYGIVLKIYFCIFVCKRYVHIFMVFYTDVCHFIASICDFLYLNICILLFISFCLFVFWVFLVVFVFCNKYIHFRICEFYVSLCVKQMYFSSFKCKRNSILCLSI